MTTLLIGGGARGANFLNLRQCELPRISVRRSSVCPITPLLRAYPMRGQDTGRYYLGLMYDGLLTSETLHKKPFRIGLGLYRTSENFYSTHSDE
jgi:hypothetical protein